MNWSDYGVSLCCEPEELPSVQGTCRICMSCGADYPHYGGKIWSGGDNNFVTSYDNQCYGDVTHRDPVNGEFDLCCKSQPVCAFCNSCGGDYVDERGVMAAIDRKDPRMFYKGEAC